MAEEDFKWKARYEDIKISSIESWEKSKLIEGVICDADNKEIYLYEEDAKRLYECVNTITEIWKDISNKLAEIFIGLGNALIEIAEAINNEEKRCLK